MTRLITIISFLACAISALAGVRTNNLTIEGRLNPTGLDEAHPRLGWQIDTDRQDVNQTAYHVLVAESPALLKENKADIWDSGIVKSDSSQWIAWKGGALQPNKEYFWKVKVYTDKGESPWSDISKWSTGLMDDRNWKGYWIGLDSLLPGESDQRHSRIASRYLRKDFAKKRKVARATMHISGLGLYTLKINGKRVGEDVLTPIPTDYTKSVAYNTYDVTPLLKADNDIEVALAGGHYFAQTQNFQTNVRTTYGYPKLLANLIIEYTDGRCDTIATDTTWQLSTDGPIRYANEYDGELFDARKIGHSYSMHARRVAAPGGKMAGNITPEMCVYAIEKPIAVKRFGNRHIVDFGSNVAGRVRLNLKAAAGDTVRIRHAELLAEGDSTLYTDNLRSAEATAIYVGDGNRRSWNPEFTYYGFRYAEITGLDKLDVKDIERELIADRMDEAGTHFSVKTADGSDMLNRILANARSGIRSNYKGMPVDCPQRDERMPWLGDRVTGALGESYVVNCHALYSKWMKDITQCQRNDGSISDVAPAYWRLYNGNMTWPAALPFICDMLYRQYGDIRPMQESYDNIKRFLAFASAKHKKDGLMSYDRYGDWCMPPEDISLVHSKDPSLQTDGRLIASAYYQYICRMMARYARIFGHDTDADTYTREADKMCRRINEEFFKDGKYANGTVTGNLLPLVTGIAEPANAKNLTDTIVSTIENRFGGHISCGVVGIQWLMRMLSESGNGDVAYRMASTPDYPGWGYMVEQGATTIWELWNGNTADPSMNSGNHVMLLGDLIPWYYEYLGGIRPDPERPGFKHVIFKPDFSIKDITEVTAEHPSPYGLIKSHWRRLGDSITWELTLPANTSGEVYLPGGKIKHIGSGKYNFTF